ncbi:uncharacterized protein [Clytia hemisphaerica]|uniref:Cnidarian restricted protein n=1 Tax=Clytia hemisphaerica TaxID=252671 RepID=A0A7M5UYU8_9CNID
MKNRGQGFNMLQILLTLFLLISTITCGEVEENLLDIYQKQLMNDDFDPEGYVEVEDDVIVDPEDINDNFEILKEHPNIDELHQALLKICSSVLDREPNLLKGMKKHSKIFEVGKILLKSGFKKLKTNKQLMKGKSYLSKICKSLLNGGSSKKHTNPNNNKLGSSHEGFNMDKHVLSVGKKMFRMFRKIWKSGHRKIFENRHNGLKSGHKMFKSGHKMLKMGKNKLNHLTPQLTKEYTNLLTKYPTLLKMNSHILNINKNPLDLLKICLDF